MADVLHDGRVMSTLLEHQICSVYHFPGKMNEQQSMQFGIVRFLRQLGGLAPQEVGEAFIAFEEKLQVIAAKPWESCPFLYLDTISWLESKISNVSVQHVMKRRFRLMK